jgi:hypothetical protein
LALEAAGEAMTDRKKPGLAFWATVVVVGLPLLYVLSFGPACWITSRCSLPGDWLFVVYAPMIWPLNNGPTFLFDAISWYSLIGVAEGWGWQIDLTGNLIEFGPTR